MSITTQPTPITTATCAATPCAKVPGSGDFFALHRLQIPFGKWRHPFATLAKPFRQVATPFCNSCKTLSASGDTPLQQMQSPVGKWRYLFTTVVMLFNQLFPILITQYSIPETQYSELKTQNSFLPTNFPNQ